MNRKSSINLNTSISELRGVGIRIEEKLQRLGIYTVQDLLFHLPLRYIDKTNITPIGALVVGNNSLIQGKIELTQVRYGKRRSLLCRVSDGTGALTLRFFYFSKAQQNQLKREAGIRCFGQPRPGVTTLEMIHPEHQFIDPEHSPSLDDHLTPVYPTTGGLGQATLRKLTGQALRALEQGDNEISEILPEKILSEFKLPDISTAITYVHHPPPDAATEELLEGTHPAQKRLAFEELLAQYLSLKQLRHNLRKNDATPLSKNGELKNLFLKKLPFALTDAQKIVSEEILSDISQNKPMLRLLQGDVGSGKTIVAVLTAIAAIESGYQTAIMVPTELLAEQHFNTISQWMKTLDVPVILMTGKLTKAERNKNLEILADKKPVIVIGTHALFQQDIKFSRLRLVIIDEQHRFGVHQRLALLEKGNMQGNLPHQLIMTATPIPRTLAMTAYADLDISIIDTLPPGRKPIKTVIISTNKRDEIITRIKSACANGRQVYWVCTLIEESEILQCEAAIDTHQYLTEKLPEVNVKLIHGRMKNSDKESVMADFKTSKVQLLVATTVIEVGVDVPNASLMIIENAERLGLFQLHQLRGRVGRSNTQSDCVLLYQAPLSEIARTRLDALRQSDNGFEIAKKDLELRGPGELMGTRQTGLPTLRIADLMRDVKMLPDIHRAAKILHDNYPEYVQSLVHRWLGRDFDYGKV